MGWAHDDADTDADDDDDDEMEIWWPVGYWWISTKSLYETWFKENYYVYIQGGFMFISTMDRRVECHHRHHHHHHHCHQGCCVFASYHRILLLVMVQSIWNSYAMPCPAQDCIENFDTKQNFIQTSSGAQLEVWWWCWWWWWCVAHDQKNFDR